MGLTKLVLRRPVSTVLAILCLIVFGLSSVMKSPLELMPDMNMSMMIVMTVYSGASPDDVSELVTKPIEDRASTLSGLDTISSQSKENMSIVMLKYKYGTDMNDAYDDLKKQMDLAKVELPEDADDPIMLELNTSLKPNVIMAVSHGEDDDLYNYVNNEIVPEFEKLSTAAEVSITGGLQKYIKVELMPDQITSTVTTAYKAYVDGKMETVNSQMSEIRQTADSISLKVTSLEAAYGTCTTGASAVDKVAACAGFALHKGATVSIRFTYANTASAPTLNVNGTGARRIVSESTGSAVRWDAGNTVSFVFSGTYWYVADCGSRSAITQLADRIELKVSKGELSSQLSVESGAITIQSNRFSWTSSYSSMTRYGVLTCTSGTIGGFTITSSSIYNNRLTLNDSGLTLRHDYNNELIGTIGVNNIEGSESTNGLVFDLEPLGDYMSWAHKRSASQDTYTMIFTYYANAYDSHAKDSLSINASKLDIYCNVNFHNWQASNLFFNLDNSGPSQGINLITDGGGLGVVRLNSPDGSRYWDVHVKRGIIID